MWKGSSGGPPQCIRRVCSIFFLPTLCKEEDNKYICPEPSLLRAEQSQLPQHLLIHHVLQTRNISVDSRWSCSSLLMPFLCGEAQRWALDTEWQSKKKDISHFSWPAGCTPLYFNLIYFNLEYLMNTHRQSLLRKQYWEALLSKL